MLSRIGLVCAVRSVFPALGVLMAVACAPAPELAPDALVTPTASQLEAFDDAVAHQLREAEDRARSALEERGGGRDERARSLLDLGRVYQAYDLAVPAADAFRQARRLEGDLWEAAYLHAVVLEMQGLGQEAQSAFDRALELRPDDLATLVRAADGRADRNDLDAASALYERALSSDPRSAAALWGLGRVQLRQGDFEAARGSLEQALRLEPRADRIHATLAELARRTGDAEAAARHARAQGTVSPSLEDPVLDAVAGLRRGVGALMARGHEATLAGRPDEAVRAYEEAVAAAPDNPEARTGLAAALVAAGRGAEALEQYRAALDLQPENPVAMYRVAAALPADRSDEAIALLERGIALAPALVQLELERLRRLVTLRELDRADQGYVALLEDDPDRFAASWGRIEVLVARGEIERALEATETILAGPLATPDRAHVHLERGRMLNEHRLEDLGTSDLEAAVALEPRALEARFALANTYGMRRLYAPAAEQYEAILAVEPSHLGARLGAVTALALAGERARARESLEEGLRYHPEHEALRQARAQLMEGDLR